MLKKRLSTIYSLASFFFVSFYNAIADDGYVIDFINGNSQNLWVWELFYIADFIMMAGALFWYNKFHISQNNMYLN